MQVYLDNAATTRVSKSVQNKIIETLDTVYGNPSSLHDLGFGAEKEISSTRKTISDYLGCLKKEIYFTSGGTEANNLAVKGYVSKNKNKGNHLITTKFEHKSVLNSFKALEEKGFEVTYLEVDSDGKISSDTLKDALREDTFFVSIMMINNETGSIQPIETLSKLTKEFNNEIVFHTDAVQAFGKYPISLDSVDLLTFSAHKIHGLKGVGGIYIKKNISIEPLISGGQQELGIRPGTENLTGIISLGKALGDQLKNRKETHERITHLNQLMRKKITDNIQEVQINSGEGKEWSPYILNISFLDMRGEVLLHQLESNQIFVSTGSACTSKDSSFSHVLEAMNLSRNALDGAIRFSFSKDNSEEQVIYAYERLKESIEYLRKIIKGR